MTLNTVKIAPPPHYKDTQAITLCVAYDRVTGTVYLNAAGQTENEAMMPIVDGSIELSDNEFENVEVVQANLCLLVEPRQAVFPVFVPVSKINGSVLVSAVGSTETEAAVNIAYAGGAEGDYRLVPADLVMPNLLPSPPDAEAEIALPRLGG